VILKAARIFFGCLLFFLTSGLLYINYKLYYQPSFTNIAQCNINEDLLNELQFLKQSLHNNAADKMQLYYPEGFLFSNAVYALSWAEVASAINDASPLYNEASEEITWAIDAINSEKGKARFDTSLQLPYGAFYTGWYTYVLGKKLSIERKDSRDSTDVNEFKLKCDQIDDAISKTIYPESYKNYSWPADVFVCLAALSLHDKLFAPKYQNSIQAWLGKVKTNLDSNGFVPYSADKNGKLLQIARGSSESLILNFLFEIDSTFGRQQFNLYKTRFLDYRLGLPGIREFAKGTQNTGDVDSGPVIFQMGSAATIVGLRVMSLYNDSTSAIAIRNGLEAFGFPFTGDDGKKYLLGKWPMADIFIAWSRSLEINKDHKLSTIDNWRTAFQLYSLLGVTVFILLLILISKRRMQ